MQHDEAGQVPRTVSDDADAKISQRLKIGFGIIALVHMGVDAERA
jgi:hypothetical protein